MALTTQFATRAARQVAPGKTSRVVVIVLNWNGREDTMACLESLEAVDYPNWEVLVVDNGSEDGSVEAIRAGYPRVVVIETGKNLGFAGGNNRGIEAALARGAEFILLLNNDTTVAPDLLRALVRAAEEHPDAGVFGAKIYFFSDPQRLWYAGARWDPRTWSFEHVGQGVLDDGTEFEQVRDTDYACGCAMFFRAAVARSVGMLDERFFILYEEADWCFRASRAGFRCLFVPKAKVWHRISTTFGGGRSIVYEYFDLRNRLLWAERNLGLRRRTRVWTNTVGLLCPLPKNIGGVLWQLVRGHFGVKQAYWEARARAREWLAGRRQPGARWVKRAQWRATYDYVTRRFGNCPDSVRASVARAKRA
jgi:GT2 family glycosyltransferase